MTMQIPVILILLVLLGGHAMADPLDPASTAPDELRAAGQAVRRSVYWEGKNLAAYVTVVRHLLHTARQNFEKGGEDARAYGARVVGLSYDLASFTWPGWNEEGIEITEELQNIGLAAAKLNVAFCTAHEVPNQVRARGYFMLGAHLISAREYDAAIEAWRKAQAIADETAARGFDGWIALARTLKEGDPSPLDSALSELESAGDQLAEAVSQIRTAYSVLGQGD